mgnify:CR=1 FL=1
MVGEYPAAGRASGDYLIIVAEDFETQIASFATAKAAQGYTVTTHAVPNGTSASVIKDYIQGRWDSGSHQDFVLLVGDTEELPGYESLTYTDNYYATVEGSDYLADIIVGRISCDSGYQCDVQVAKILGYDSDYKISQRERIKGGYAWRPLLDAGVVLANGSDFPVELANPWHGLYASVTRQSRDGLPEGGWYPDQALTRAEALLVCEHAGLGGHSPPAGA